MTCPVVYCSDHVALSGKDHLLAFIAMDVWPFPPQTSQTVYCTEWSVSTEPVLSLKMFRLDWAKLTKDWRRYSGTSEEVTLNTAQVCKGG